MDDFRYLDQVDDIAGIPKPGRQSSTNSQQGDSDPTAPLVNLASYLEQIEVPQGWVDWNAVLMAIYAASGGSDLGLDLATEWSERGAKYVQGEVEERWEAYKGSLPSRIGAGMLRRMARDAEWLKKAAEWIERQGAEVPDGDEWSNSATPFLMTLEELFNQPEREPLIDGLLMEGEDTCLVGMRKSGKSFVALDIGLSIAAGISALEKLPTRKSGPVVYLAGEGVPGFPRRIAAWAQRRGVKNVRDLPFYVKAGVPASAKGAEEALRYVQQIERQVGKPVLVIIDTMARSLGELDENTANAANLYLNITGAIRDGLTTSVLTLAHSSDKEKASKGIRGSSAFGAGFDSVWLLEKNDKNGVAKLDPYLMKDGDLADFPPLCFKLQPETVAGMKNGKGAVLVLVELGEFVGSGETSTEKVGEGLVRHMLLRGKRYGTENALTEKNLALDLAGLEPKEDETQLAWETRLKQTEAGLRAARSNRAWAKGLFGKLVMVEGGPLEWCWFLPESERPVEPDGDPW